VGGPLMLQLAVSNPGVEAKPSTLPDAVVAKMPSSEVADLLPVALANAPLPLSFLNEFGRMSPERLDELVRIGILHPTGEGRVEILEAIRRAIVSRAGPLDLEAHRTLASYYLRSHRSDMVRERFLHLVAGEDWRSASEVLVHEETKILSLGYSDALRNALNHMTLAMPLGPGRLRALRVQAELLRTHSEYSEAILLLRRASTDAGEDRRTRAECQLKIADLQIRLKQVESARATLDEARKSAPATKRLRSMFQFYEARLVEARGDLTKARELFQTCFEQARKDRQSEVALEALARWSRQASIGGAHEVALRMVEQGLPEARASGQLELVFNLLLVRARAYQETGKPELADLEMRQIRAETEAKGHLNELIYTLSGLVAMTMEAGKWEEAGEFAREAISLAERLGNETVLGHTLAALAAGELRQGKLGQAREHAERSVLVLSRLPVSDSLVFARSYLTEVYTAMGEASLARQEFHAAVQLAASMGMQWWVDQMESEFKSKIENLHAKGSGGSASGASPLPSPAEQAEGG
jgi:tetratricopeptide (TPR) repeat protein